MGAPIGNKNAGKSKPWSDAIRRAIARHDAKNGDGHFWNAISDQLVIDCLKNEKMAIDELTQRLEGKVAQTTVLAGDEDNPVTIAEVRRVIVDPNNPNS